MANSVVLKGTPYGISVIISEATDYDEIKRNVIDKFVSSEGFFKGAKVAISFEGDQLKDNYQVDLLKAISDNTEIDIACLIDKDEETVAYYKDIIDAMNDNLKEPEDYHDYSKIIRGDIKSGEKVDLSTGVLIYGGVEAGASVISESDIIILGEAKGFIKAGVEDNKSAVVYATDFDDAILSIGGITELAESGSKSFFKKRKKKNNELIMAYVKDDKIFFKHEED